MTTASAQPRLMSSIRPTLAADNDTLVAKVKRLHTFDDVADLVEITPALLKTLLYGVKARNQYVAFDIPKRGGGSRTIHAPPKNLRILQQKLNHILSLVYTPRTCVHGFSRHRSICTNANLHGYRKWVLNIDLEDFFGHVTIGRLIGALGASPFNIPKIPATIIGQIACLADGRLPQGSPCSPILSNIVAYGLDVVLLGLARQHHCTYSRYADDISFSTSKTRFSPELAHLKNGETHLGNELIDAVKSAGFTIHPLKRKLQHTFRRQEVTGLTVNEFPNVRRSYVRHIRGILHAWKTHGYEAAQAELNRRLETGREDAIPLGNHVRGKLAFLQAVRGRDDPIVRKLLKQLQTLDPNLVQGLPVLTELTPSPLRGHRFPSLSWEKVMRRIQPSVMFLEVDHVNGNKFAATAFKITERLLATAGHNLNQGNIRAWLNDEIAMELEKYHWNRLESEADVGLLATVEGKQLPGSPLRTELRLPEVGEQVAAVGYPSQPLRYPTISLSVGIVESLPVSYPTDLRFIQVSFESAGGLSGAPLIDRGGHVVGIMTGNTSVPIEEGQFSPRVFGHAAPFEYLYELWRLKR